MNPVLAEMTRHIDLPTDTLAEQDPEIRDIFIEEVEEIVATQQDLIPKWVHDPYDPQLLSEIRRSFHTLKGSGRMVGANISGELAWAIEEMLNRVIAGMTLQSEEIQELVYSVSTLYRDVLIPDFKSVDTHATDVRPFIAAAHELRDHQDIPLLLVWTITYYQSRHIPTDAELDALMSPVAPELVAAPIPDALPVSPEPDVTSSVTTPITPVVAPTESVVEPVIEPVVAPVTNTMTTSIPTSVHQQAEPVAESVAARATTPVNTPARQMINPVPVESSATQQTVAPSVAPAATSQPTPVAAASQKPEPAAEQPIRVTPVQTPRPTIRPQPVPQGILGKLMHWLRKLLGLQR